MVYKKSLALVVMATVSTQSWGMDGELVAVTELIPKYSVNKQGLHSFSNFRFESKKDEPLDEFYKRMKNQFAVVDSHEFNKDVPGGKVLAFNENNNLGVTRKLVTKTSLRTLVSNKRKKDNDNSVNSNKRQKTTSATVSSDLLTQESKEVRKRRLVKKLQPQTPMPKEARNSGVVNEGPNAVRAPLTHSQRVETVAALSQQNDFNQFKQSVLRRNEKDGLTDTETREYCSVFQSQRDATAFFYGLPEYEQDVIINGTGRNVPRDQRVHGVNAKNRKKPSTRIIPTI